MANVERMKQEEAFRELMRIEDEYFRDYPRKTFSRHEEKEDGTIYEDSQTPEGEGVDQLKNLCRGGLGRNS